ncbi:type I secretion system permease/ATPase [Beggiatoa leptomitoformis]|uniref:Type I secretion system permease/ATPase n=1 Tax=Beggiatoa leptomitoformis TaxID=288004 RepID=A0A2N9YFD2_9GAMM|nr:type I secretion system permease/ATPase [Beggiatoa leptomitoformis]ALG68523.1 type I secretion system permease/ATPase [Beggiatoa leptomitoformis]AUI69136.1 type I secretion system permease/ATPase [Beggiatoa leptomitoformis]
MSSDTLLDDPLLACLVILTKLNNKPFSADALRAGLPLENNQFSPATFIRSAERAGLSARLAAQPLASISALYLPAVLLLTDGQACILLKQVGKKRVQVIFPAVGEGSSEIELSELAKNYSGSVLFARPVYAFDQRTAEAEHAPRPRSWFWGTLWQSWGLYTEVLLASLLINLFALASPLFVMNVYDRVVPNNALETLWVLAIGMLIVFVFDFLMRSLRGYFIDVAGKRADIVLSSRVFEQVLGSQRSAHPTSVGAFANQLHEFESFRDFFTSATLTAVIDLPFALLFVVAIWGLLHPALALLPLFAIPLIILFSLLLQLPLRKVIQQTTQASAQKQAVLVETLSGLETLKTVRAEGNMQRRWELLMAQLAQGGLKVRYLSALSVNFSVFIQQLTSVIVVVYGVYLIADKEITTGTLIAATILTGRALAPMAQVVSLITRYHQSLQAFKSLDRLMRMPLERPLNHPFVHRPLLQGNIEFKQVAFSYPQQAQTVLQAVSFGIQAGERVGIIGRIGSGKSTIAKLLLSLYPPESGSILVDGVDSRQIDPEDLRRNMGYVAQDPTLFYGTVRDNIVLGAPYADDAQVLRAATLAGVTDFVNRHPLGFDMRVGERGEGLSGGQRQAIVLARAFLLNPPILLLDEPSNAMDSSTEEALKARLSPYLADKTLILVTHRQSLLSLVERLIVVDNGQVMAVGEREQVIQALRNGEVRVGQ